MGLVELSLFFKELSSGHGHVGTLRYSVRSLGSPV